MQRSALAPLLGAAAVLVATLVIIDALLPPDPWPFVLVVAAAVPIIWLLVVSQRRQAAWLRDVGVTAKMRSLPWPVRLLWAMPLLVFVAARGSGAEGPLPAVLFVGTFTAVAVLFSRLLRSK